MALRHKLIGRVARLYCWLRRPRTLGVRSLVLDDERRVALVRHTYADSWYLPGGGVKRNESFEDALKRELREEIGLEQFKIERILGVYHSRREYKDDHVVVFVTRLAEGTSATLAKVDLLEIEEVAWFPVDALPDDISAATARRIAEYRKDRVGSGAW